jgi:SPP1 family phage portal protein
MELTELLSLLNTPAELVKKVQAHPSPHRATKEELRQYQPETHDIFDQIKRKDRPKENGEVVHLARIPLALQKLITKRSVAFLTGAPVKLEAAPEGDQEKKLLAMVEKTWADNKLDYKTGTLAKVMKSEKEAVELWYVEELASGAGYWGELGNSQSRFRLRMRILKPSEGNEFFPIYNNFLDMVAFGRGYKLKQEGGKEREHLDVYTADFIIKLYKVEGEWVLLETVPNFIGKIPLVYYHQPRTEAADVQWAIDRLETLLSNFADTNDYFGSPVLVVKGKVLTAAEKGDSGKMLELEGDHADVKYVTWDHAPAAIKLEIETLLDLIYTLTQTPNISFKEMKGLGALSGIAIKLMFLDAHSKAKEQQDGDFGECIQRRINLLKAVMAKINVSLASAVELSITPKFDLFMPDHEVEAEELTGKRVENLLLASGNKPLITQKTAVELGPLEVENREEEFKKLQEQATEEKVTPDLGE